MSKQDGLKPKIATKVLRVPGNPVVERDIGRVVRVILPEWLIIKMERSADVSYGKRGQSRWVDEALIQLIAYPEWDELLFGQSINTGGRIKQFRLSPTGTNALDEAIRKVRQSDPFVEGVISEVIRTAISQRLLRSRDGLRTIDQE